MNAHFASDSTHQLDARVATLSFCATLAAVQGPWLGVFRIPFNQPNPGSARELSLFSITATTVSM